MNPTTYYNHHRDALLAQYNALRLGGNAAEDAERGFQYTSADELIGYANRRAIALRSRSTQPDFRRPGITWETLVFTMPNDGAGTRRTLSSVKFRCLPT